MNQKLLARMNPMFCGVKIGRKHGNYSPASPIFGSGLGGFLHHYQEKVIHNVPLWILTEMGIIGLLLILPLAIILLTLYF